MSERHDFYRHIHKGLRLGGARLLVRLGQADWAQPAASAELLADLRGHLALARKHLEHEDAEINVIMRTKALDLGLRLDHDHADHFAAFGRLEAAIKATEQAAGIERERAGHRLYLAFSRHVGEDLLHMAREEEEAMPVFQARYDDGELQAIENRIKGSIPLDELIAYFRLILPGCAPAERVALLADIRAGAPAEVYAIVEAQAARVALDDGEWRALQAGLAQLPAAA